MKIEFKEAVLAKAIREALGRSESQMVLGLNDILRNQQKGSQNG